MRRCQVRLFARVLLIGLLLSFTSAHGDEGPGNPDYVPLGYSSSNPEGRTGGEVTDIVFVVDGSGSISGPPTGAF